MTAEAKFRRVARRRAGRVRAHPSRTSQPEGASRHDDLLNGAAGRLHVQGFRLAAVTAVAVGLVTATLTSPAYAQVEVTPTAEGFPGGAMIQTMINWVGQFGLWGSLASILVGAGIWGVSQQFGNGLQAGKGKILAAAGAIGAVLTGLAPVIVNTLYTAARA